MRANNIVVKQNVNENECTKNKSLELEIFLDWKTILLVFGLSKSTVA